MPGKDGAGLHEDIRRDLYLLAHTPRFAYIIIVYTFCITVYNIFLMRLTQMTSATTYLVFDNARTVNIWLIVLLLSTFDPGDGERLGVWTLIQLGGYVGIIGGIYCYTRGKPAKPDALIAERELDSNLQDPGT